MLNSLQELLPQTLGFKDTLDNGSEAMIAQVIDMRDQFGPKSASDLSPGFWLTCITESKAILLAVIAMYLIFRAASNLSYSMVLLAIA